MPSGAERRAAQRRLTRGGVSPDARPRPDLPPGTDTRGEIQHVVILMLENHSYDNYLGMLAGHGDGLPLGADGDPVPVHANPGADGAAVPLRHFPGTVQDKNVPTQSWHASHLQYGGGACDGFARSVTQTLPGLDATVPMSYWTEADLPFYYWLARTFPLATRWFCSCLGPTFPNRRFLISGTALGMIDDLPFTMIDYPRRGTLFDLLDAHGISWANYHQLKPFRIGWRRLTHARGLNFLRVLGGVLAALIPALFHRLVNHFQVTSDLYPLGFFRSWRHVRPIRDFWAAAAAGTLPSVSIVDPDFGQTSEENPQDIRDGEAFAAQVIQAVTSGPGWPRTLLIWLYDEHGGYYDHVPPPAAVPPDDIPGTNPLRRFPWSLLRFFPVGREIERSDAGPGDYGRLGFRVPAVVVSPYARRGPNGAGYVGDQVYDHTSVLKLIENKWNLPPLTRRDQAARDPLPDLLDFDNPPAFLTPPAPPAAAGPQPGGQP